MFLVCAELSRRNLIALPTSRNTKGYDIVVMHPETGKSIGIQVKCTDKKAFPILNSHYGDYTQVIEDKIVCPFVFVDISDKAKPRYFILSDKEMEQSLKKVIEGSMKRRGERLGQNQEEILQKEKGKKPQLWALALGEIECFENHWEVIKTD
jgi:hypothetical protein